MNSASWYNYINKDALNVLALGRMIKTLGGVSMSKSISGIYAIVNRINGDRYVGSAYNISKRWSQHIYELKNKKHHSRHLQNAWNKYGENSFIFVVLQECRVEDLIIIEQEYLDDKPEYNICIDARSPLGLKRSEEAKQKMSEMRKGKCLGNTNALGKHWKQTKEHSEKIGKTKIGNSYGRGHKMTQEHKNKLLEATKKRWEIWRKNKDD